MSFPPCSPAPLERQRAMAAARASVGGDHLAPEDSASQVSWSVVVDEQRNVEPVQEVPMQFPEPKAPPPGFRHQGEPAPGYAAQGQDQPKSRVSSSSGSAPFPPADAALFFTDPAQAPAQSAAAPATQAARDLLGSAQKQAARLAKQKAQAKRRGHRAVRWGQMPGLDAQNFQLPTFIRQLGAGQDERSVLVIDSRDRRIQSPYQGWLLDEILLNAQSGVNVLVDRQLVRSPNKGYHLNLFYVRTMDGFKFILVVSMTSYGTVPAARWDADTGKIMAHPAFQPFRWPMMTDESATWVDVKVKVEGGLLLHLELRGYRSNTDMTVQMNCVNDALMANLRDCLFVPSCIVTVFHGWRVVATSFEVGGRLYACSDGGTVVALDFPLCHFEVRLTALSSTDSIGMDADRLEFRFRSSGDQLDVACSQVVVPSTWLVVSRVSGPTLIKNARWCREHHARVEGPDQTMQLSQLAGIHAHWTASIEAESVDDTGPRVSAVAVDSHPANYHLTCESPLFRAAKSLVPTDALALQAHNVALEQETIVLPPVTGGPSVVPRSSVAAPLQALAGPSAPALVVAPNVQAEVSMTEPGQAPASGAMGGSVHVQRRSLEARQQERISVAAVTPQTFLDQVYQAVPGRPVSFGPAPTVEEVTET